MTPFLVIDICNRGSLSSGRLCTRPYTRPGLERPFIGTFEKGVKPWKAGGNTNEKAARKGATRGIGMNEQTTAQTERERETARNLLLAGANEFAFKMLSRAPSAAKLKVRFTTERKSRCISYFSRLYQSPFNSQMSKCCLRLKKLLKYSLYRKKLI